MSEAATSAVPLPAMTAGRLLREARQAQGLHIAALASAIKVAPRKLESLEADRFDELPDATFTRALAQTVCRSLKVDAAPILALLPRAAGNRLGQTGAGLNAPFRERPGRLVPNDWSSIANPALWGPALVLLIAGAVYLMPAGLLPTAATRARPPADAAPVTALPPSPIVPLEGPTTVLQAPASTRVATASESTSAPGPSEPPAVPAATGAGALAVPAPVGVSTGAASAGMGVSKLLSLHAAADSWVEVIDAHGRPLISRLVKSGESVELEGATPLRLKIGNASATEVTFRGQVLALAPFTRDNLARLELK